MAFLPGPTRSVPREIEQELINLDIGTDVPKKEKPGTIRILKLRKGFTFSVSGKKYEVVRIRGNTLFCRYKGDDHA